MSQRAWLLSTTSLAGVAHAVFLSTMSAAADLTMVADPPLLPPAESLPAVSQPNAKIDLRIGSAFDDASVFGTGAFTFPLGHRFGAQLDGVVGLSDDDFTVQGAGHLFWRDPSFALFGAYGSWTYADDFGGVDLGIAAAEIELYLGQVTFGGLIGAQFSDDSEVEDGFFTDLRLGFYPVDDLKIFAGYRHDQDLNIATAGAEWQLPLNRENFAASVFAEGRYGEDDYRAIWLGVRTYFGPNKSLIRRHREDDPPVYINLIKGKDVSSSYGGGGGGQLPPA